MSFFFLPEYKADIKHPKKTPKQKENDAILIISIEFSIAVNLYIIANIL